MDRDKTSNKLSLITSFDTHFFFLAFTKFLYNTINPFPISCLCSV